MAMKVGLVSLGCSKNQVDAERILYKVKQAGYKIETDAGMCDIVIINTCGFIQSAKEEAIETILEFVQLKNEGRIKKIVISGCLAERYQNEVVELIPEVDAVMGIGCNDDILDILDRILAEEQVIEFKPKNSLALTGDRIISNLPFFAYLKIAEGCSNCCTYCAIPAIRGGFRSVPMEDVIKEAEYFAENGVTELNIIAQDSTRYGIDIYQEYKLPELLQKICKIDGIKWVRVLYCYPERVSDELIETIANEEKIVKYIDLPIQHCNDKILKEMNRSGSREELTQLIEKLRARIPEIVIRTTLITGFPGETDEQFTELAEFVNEMKFDRLGCFAYSEEEGTIAAERTDQVDEEVRIHRAEIIMEQQQIIMQEKNEAMIGKELVSVVEGFDRLAECYFGRTRFDAPDIDGKIFFNSEKKLAIGDYVRVEIEDVMDYDLIGVVVDEFAE